MRGVFVTHQEGILGTIRGAFRRLHAPYRDESVWEANQHPASMTRGSLLRIKPIDSPGIELLESRGFENGDGGGIGFRCMGFGQLHHVIADASTDFHEQGLAISLLAIGFRDIQSQQSDPACLPAVDVAIESHDADARQGSPAGPWNESQVHGIQSSVAGLPPPGFGFLIQGRQTGRSSNVDQSRADGIR